MMKLIFHLLLVFIIIFLFSCKNSTESESELTIESYPTKLYPLQSDELENLQNEFDLLNDYELCTRLNVYGFTSGEDCRTTNPGIVLPDTQLVLYMAKSCLFKNQKFTNVTDTAQLSVQLIRKSVIDGTGWEVWFYGQVYKNLEVLNTNLRIYLYANGVYCIDGHWYPDLIVPDVDLYDESAGRESLYGYIIEGFQGQGSTYHVTESSFSAPGKKVILPVFIGQKIELSVTWEYEIENSWHIYLDTSTGEILKVHRFAIF